MSTSIKVLQKIQCRLSRSKEANTWSGKDNLKMDKMTAIRVKLVNKNTQLIIV